MDADSFSVRDVLDERQEFLKSGRPSPLDGVRPFGDEVVGIFKGREGALGAVHLKGEGSGYGFTLCRLSGQSYGSHILICIYSRYPRRKWLTMTSLLRNS